MISKPIKVSGHKSNTQITLEQFFILEKKADVIPTVTGDSWLVNTRSNFFISKLKIPKKY